MTETERIVDELERAVKGDPWHGSPLASVVSAIPADIAAQHPIEGAHSIWELVLHLTGWAREVARRVGGSPAGVPPEGDWPPVGQIDDQHWATAREALMAAHLDLIEAVRVLPEGRIDTVVGGGRDAPLGSGVSFYVTLHGLAQHDAYHAGQISLLKKASGRHL